MSERCPFIVTALMLIGLPMAAYAQDNSPIMVEKLPSAMSEPTPANETALPGTILPEEDAAALAKEAEAAKPSGPLSPTDKIVRRFMELDLDSSEGVSFEEYMSMVNQRAEDRFKSMDANQDEEVSEEEYRTFWQTRKAQWYRLKR